MQFLILRDAKNACQLLALLFDAPEDIFRKAAATRYLSVSQADALAAAYAAFTSIMQLMRLTSAGEFDPGNAASGVLRRIALAMNAPDFRHVSAELDAHRKEVRAIFSKLIG